MSWGCLQELDVESGCERTWELCANEVAVGRQTNTKADEKMAIKWPKAYVSGHHFSITRSSDGLQFELCDRSSNGTFLNSVLIGKGKSARLQHGDTIQLRFKSVDKIVLTFITYAVSGEDRPISPASELKIAGRPEKRQRVAEGEGGYFNQTHVDSNLLSIKISALEQDNKQQEARIEAYITKLETSTRENSNLLRELKAAQDTVEEKGSQLDDLKQQCSTLEAHNNAIEARYFKLEESLQTQKVHGEKLRSQLAVSEQRSAQTNELLLKVDTLTDELNHRKSQNEAKSAMYEELSISLENERKRRESIEAQVLATKSELDFFRREALSRKRAQAGLEAEKSRLEQQLKESQAAVELLEDMGRQVKREEVENKSDFSRKVSALQASMGQVQAEIQALHTAHPPRRLGDTVQVCFSALQQMQQQQQDQLQKDQQQQDQLQGEDDDDEGSVQSPGHSNMAMTGCTQLPHSPEQRQPQHNYYSLHSANKTMSADSTVAFSRSTEALDCTQTAVAGATCTADSVKLSKYGHNSEHRQSSMLFDSICMTEDEIDVAKITDDITAQHNTATLGNDNDDRRVVSTTQIVDRPPPTEVEEEGENDEDEGGPAGLVAPAHPLRTMPPLGAVSNERDHGSQGGGGGDSEDDASDESSSLVGCDVMEEGGGDDEYDVTS